METTYRPGIHSWPESYLRIGSLTTATGDFATWVSTTGLDPLWDEFLRKNPGGQFQQSSLWAEYKAGEGWQHHRVVATDASGIAGGFQLLWKKSRFASLGYVSKGPITHRGNAELEQQLARLVQSVARELGLSAVIVQRPDELSFTPATYEIQGFVRSNPMSVIEATYLVDVRDNMDVVRTRMSSSLRRNLRAGKRRGVVLREGTEADLGRFFELMATTCRRQRTAPNPASLAAIQRLWSVFSPTNSIRLILAEHGDAIIAAKLNLQFGRKVTVWKKGWDGTHGESHPNELLEEESLEWAHTHGYEECDLCSFNAAAAAQACNGKLLRKEDLSSRDEYHLRLGGRPKLLPPSLVFIPNPLLRWAYRNVLVPVERQFFRTETVADNARSDV